jgi:Peptidase C13 family
MLKVFLLIVVGLGGDPETAKTFHRWGNTLVESSQRLGVPPERLVHLVGEPVEGDVQVSGRSTREEVTKALTKFAAEAGPEDLVFITLIGHGQWDGRAAKFNMPGPDMGPEEFEPLLKKIRSKQIVLVNTASSSGPFVEALSAPGRTLVSATRSGAEHYTTLFGGFFVDALNSPTADGDKNKRISVLEAFQFAKAEVTRAYEREGLLATEHPLLDDDGDRKGSGDPTPTGADGKVAAVLSLGDASDDGLPTDPKLRELHLERRELERRVESLRLLKDSMDPARYASELEKLVTAVALKTREIRAAEGK